MNIRQLCIISIFMTLLSCNKYSGGDTLKNAKYPRANSSIQENQSNAEEPSLVEKIGRMTATEPEIELIFERMDTNDLYSIINLLSGYRHNAKVINLLKGVWGFKYKAYPNFSWETIKKPQIRIALAQVLGQIDRNNLASYYDYVLTEINNTDEDVRLKAIGALGIIGSNKDISLLEKIILGNKINDAMFAAVALSSIRSPESKNILENLLKNVAIDERVKDIIKQGLKNS